MIVARALRRERWLAGLAALAVFGVPFAAYTIFMLYQLYVRGSFLADVGWQVFVAANGGVRLPLALGSDRYFIGHLSPIFIPVSAVRRALPISDAQFFAGFIGLCHALPGLGVFWVLRSGFGLRGGLSVATAALVAIAFAFNGLALAIIRYPHTEILVVGGVILFAAALVRQKPLAAAMFFTLALLTREDAGFHLFGLLFVLIALNRWYGVPWRAQRLEIAFAAGAFAYSIAGFLFIFAVQRSTSTEIPTLTLTYLGDPPFAKLTLDALAVRLLGYPVYRAYLIWPAFLAAIWAARTRNPYILVGYVAFVPWGLLQVIAYSDIPGTLSGYYAYPFMIAGFWPLCGVLLDWRRRGIEGRVAKPISAFAAMVALSFAAVGVQYNPARLDLLQALLDPPSPARQAATETAIAAFVRSKPALGAVAADTSVVALAPNDFTQHEAEFAKQATQPQAIIYFAQGYDAKNLRVIATEARLNRHYRVPGTSLRLATERPIPPDAPIAPMLVPADASD
jgi:uncharacterized membrane protein